VLVTGTLSPFTDEAGVCPCELLMFLLSETGESSELSSTVFGGDASPADGQYKGSVSMSHLFTAPSGVEVGYAIIAQITPTLTPSAGNTADTFVSLQATYVPFTEDGGNPTMPSTTAGRPDLRFGKWPFGNHKIH
jgi:hypothetical protein